ncbi:YDG domain-containing protein [Roseateles albus]|uniref:YDG domain-containing protein n=1 Tax=Roseateles albus TaxID=2987525 RepID=A0ABT5KCB5_9BURK|nr:YDG domain-containing protein [Roseateles albus]MDC8770640.1 YDG domain-containing protein [Roseateles albus]
MNEHASINRLYRLVWNENAGTWVAVSELSRGRGKRNIAGGRGFGALIAVLRSLPALLALGFGCAQAAPAVNTLPQGGQVVAGQAVIGSNSARMDVNQSSQRAAIDWQSFNLGANAQVNFKQPNSASVTLNRVLDAQPSQIFGRISSNGQVFLSNPAGIYFSPSASADVGALTATTHGISTADFMAGKTRFDRNGATGSVINEGQLTAHLGGYIALLAPEVRNSGVIMAQAGTVALAAGEMIELQLEGQRLTKLLVSPSDVAALVDNRQAVLAPDGLILLSARAAQELQGGVIKHSGSLQANSLTERGGRIVLEADQISLASASRIEAAGAQGGGTVLVGGDWQGSGAMHQASQVTMDASASIDASATHQGDGGKVVLWSDIHNPNAVTRAQGSILAQGGAQGGKGGQVETSGYKLVVDGVRVSTAAPLGVAGDWLLDPYNITIGSSTSGTSYSPPDFTSAATSTILASDVSNALTSNNVTIQTGGTAGDGQGNGDITVATNIAKTGATTTTLTLKAHNDIIVNGGVRISATGGALNVTLNSDSDGIGGGGIAFTGSGSVGGITSNGGNIVMGGGADPTTTAAFANRGVDLSDNVAINAGAGNVSIRGTSNRSTADTGIGVRLFNEASIAGANVTVIGTGSANAGSSQRNWGVSLESSSVITGSGTTVITGSGGAGSGAAGGNNNHGIFLDSNSSITASGSNAMTLTGTGGGTGSSTPNFGIYLAGNSLVKTTGSGALALIGTGGMGSGAQSGINISGSIVSAEGAGAGSTVAITGTGGVGASGSDNYGVIVQSGGTVKSAGGAISFSGTGGANGSGSSNFGIVTLSPSTIGDNNSGAITLQATGASGSDDLSMTGSTFGGTTYAGNIAINADTFSYSASTLQTTGALTIAPRNSFASTFTWSGSNAGSLAGLTVNSLSSLGGLTLGKAGNTADINVGSSTSIAGPISIYGRNVTLNAGLASTASNAALLIKAAGDILQQSSLAVSSNGGTITYNSDSDASAAGAIRLQPGASVSSSGGNIVFGGGANPLTTAAFSSNNGLGNGVELQGASVNAGAGNVSMRGHGADTGGYSDGVRIIGTSASVTGGDITLVGQGSSVGGGNARGVMIENGASVTGAGAVSVTGTGGAANNNGNVGVAIYGTNPPSIRATGTGTVTLVGAGGGTGGSNNNDGIYIGGASTVRTESGALNLTGTAGVGGGSQGFEFAGVALGNATQSGNTTLTANSLLTSGSNSVLGSGTVLIQSLANSFDSAVSTANWSYANTLTGLTIGKTSNTADITVSNAASIAGPISIYGGNIGIDAALTATGTSTTTLTATGSINGSGLMTSSTVDLNAVTGIGATTPLNLAASSISADTTGGRIALNNALATATTVTSLTSASSTDQGFLITFNQTGGGAVNFTNVSTVGSTGGFGDIRLSNTGANLTIGTAATTSGDSRLFLTTTTSGNIVLTGSTGSASPGDGGLNFNSAGNISGAGLVTGSSFATLRAQTGISLNTNLGDIYQEIVTAAGDITINNTLGFSLPSITAPGNLTLISNGGLIRQYEDYFSLAVAGTTNLTAGSGNDITLTNATNNFTGGVRVVSGRNVSLNDTDALVLGNANGSSTISGTLTATASGAITQAGALAVTGASNLTAGSGNNITLTNAANNFTGGVRVVSGNNVSLTDTNALVLGNANGVSTISGTLTATASGAITQAGALAVAGASNLTPGSSNSITLTNSNNDFAGDVSIVSGAAVSIKDVNGLNLGTSAVSGNLTAEALSGNLNVNGNLNNSTSGATVVLKASGDITQASAAAVSTNNGAVTYWANSDASGSGAILLSNGSSLSSNGGNIVMGGGASPATTAAIGSASNADGIKIDGATVSSGSGTITLTGQGANTGGNGVLIQGTGSAQTSVVQSSSGDISISGTGTGTGGARTGVYLLSGGTTRTTGGGNLTLTGQGSLAGTSNNNEGVKLQANALAEIQTGSNRTLSITGTGGSGTSYNIGVNALASVVRMGATATGQMVVTGTGGTCSNTGCWGVLAENTSAYESLGAANISIIGTGGTGSDNQGFKHTDGSNRIGADGMTGAITMEADRMDLTGVGGLMTLRSAGALSIRPKTAGTTIGIAGGSGTLALTASHFANNFSDGFSSITIGGATMGNITVGGAVTLRDSTTLRTDGLLSLNGAITANENLTLEAGTINQSSALSVAGNLNLAADGGSTTYAGSHNASSIASAITVATPNTSPLTYRGQNGNVYAIAVSGTPRSGWGGGSDGLGFFTDDTPVFAAGAYTGVLSSASIGGTVYVRIDPGQSSYTGGIRNGITMANYPTWAGSYTVLAANLPNDITLNHASNQVGGQVTVQSGRNVTLVGASALNLGAVTATGLVDVSTRAGDLNLSGVISTSSTSSSAIKLNSGSTASAGTATGGNLLVSGGSMSVGTGGRATLFTGSVSGSTGLTALIGSGSGRFRYNSDETTTNYSLGLGVGAHAIYRERPTLTVSADSLSRVYGSSSPALSASVSGVNGDTAAQALSTAPTIAIGGTASNSNQFIVGDHSLTPSGAVDRLGYSLSYSNGNLNVTPATLSAFTGITAANKVYDGTTAATLNSSAAAFTGKIGVDDVSIGSASGTFANKAAGSGKTVTITGLSLLGADAGNYVADSSTASTTADIARASISAIIGITAANKVYDGTTGATLNSSGAAFTGKVNGDVLNVATANGAFANKTAATGKTVTITGLTLGGADADNYVLDNSTASTSANIEKAAISAITGITAANKVYDGTTTATLNSSAAAFTGKVSADVLNVATANGAFANKTAATGKTVTITGLTLGGADADNYVLDNSTASTSANIEQAVISAITGITAANKVYDGTTAATLNSSAAAFTGKIGGDVLKVATASGAFANKTAANGKAVSITGLSLGGVDAENYVLGSSTASTSANIEKAAISAIIGISAVNKVYDGTTAATLNSSAAAFNGKASGDVLNVATASGVFASKTAANGKTVAITGLSLGGSDADNYVLDSSTASTTADIARAAITAITGITAANKVYDGNTSTTLNSSAAEFTGKIGADSLTVATANGAFANKTAANGKAVAITGLSLGGGDADNYLLSSDTASTSASIEKAVISAITGITAANKVYDGTTAATLTSSGTAFTGKVSGDRLSVATANGTFANKSAATGKTVSITGLSLGGGDADNYLLGSSTASTTADITRAPISAVTGITAESKVEDGTTAAQLRLLEVGFAGKLVDDQLLVASATGNFDNGQPGQSKPIAITALSLGGADAGNYQLQADTASTTADISPRPVPPLPPAPPVAPPVPPQPPSGESLALPTQAPNLGVPATIPASNVSATAAPSLNTPGVTVDMTRNPDLNQTGIVSVLVPRSTATAGGGFKFSLPDTIVQATKASGGTPSTSALGGEALPGWLRFDAATLSFVASAVPDGALPYQARVTIDGKSTIIVIAERSD